MWVCVCVSYCVVEKNKYIFFIFPAHKQTHTQQPTEKKIGEQKTHEKLKIIKKKYFPNVGKSK